MGIGKFLKKAARQTAGVVSHGGGYKAHRQGERAESAAMQAEQRQSAAIMQSMAAHQQEVSRQAAEQQARYTNALSSASKKAEQSQVRLRKGRSSAGVFGEAETAQIGLNPRLG